MPGSATIRVDTSSMASAIDSVRRGVDSTTSAARETASAVERTTDGVKATSSAVGQTTHAVQGMMTAVVAAEAAAAHKVSTKVSTGFLGLIRTQLAQKKVESFTVMQSKCQILGHKTQALRRIKEQLRKDYERISRRYSKIINQLNGNLKSRIAKLDAPAVEVSSQGYKALEKRVLVTGAPIPALEQNVIPLSCLVGLAHCRRECADASSDLRNFVSVTKKMKRAIASSMHDEGCHDVGRKAMPVVLFEAENPAFPGTSHIEVVTGEHAEQKTRDNMIRSSLFVSQSALKWRASGSAREIVINRIAELANAEKLDDRVASYVNKLATASDWKELEA